MRWYVWLLLALVVLSALVYFDRNARGAAIELFEAVGLPSNWLYEL